MRKSVHAILFSTAALAAASLGVPQAAYAQEAQPSDSATEEPAEQSDEADDNEEDVIVVTGSRAIARSFVDVKRESVNIVDSIGEDEAGNLPVQNVAELVSVLPGVHSITDRTGDDNLTTSESRFANVRGIRSDLNITTMDGLNLAIPNEGGRSNFLDWFPVSLAKRVEVIKSFAPENDGNAIGGQVNVVTRSGFDYPDGILNLSASATFNELDDGVVDQRQPFNLSAVFARPLSDSVSVALTGNFNRRDVFVPSKENVGRIAFNDDGSRATFFPGFNNFIGPVPGNGIAVPLTNRLYSNLARTDRWGLAGKIDFRPSDLTYLWLTGAYSKLNQRVLQSYSDVRSAFICFSFLGCVNRATSQVDENGTIEVSFNDAAFSETATSRNVSQLGSVQFGGQHLAENGISAELKGSYSEAKQDQEDYFSFYGQNARSILLDYDLGDPLDPQFAIRDAASVLDPATYNLRRVDYIPLSLKERVFDGTFNVGYNVDRTDSGFGAKAGVRFKSSDRDKKERFVQNNVTELGGQTFTLDQILADADPFDLNIPGLNSSFYPVLGNPLARNALLLPRLADATLFTPSLLTDLENNYELAEKTYAAFVQAQYRNDYLQAVAGLRYEATSLKGSGYRSVDGGGFEPVRNAGKQGFWLPSVILNFDPAHDLRLRASYSKSLGRPPYSALAPRGETLTTDLQLGTATLSRSNPDLKPRQSHNFDLAAEWNFAGRGSLVSLGAFHKDIKDEIFVQTELVPMEIDGTIFATTIVQPANASGAELYGLEASLVYNFTFLPAPLDNIGMNANATVIRGDFDLKRSRLDGQGSETPGFLPGQPENIYNISLYYSDPRLDLNLSWNRTGAYVAGFFADAPQNDIYLLGRSVINAKASYGFAQGLKVFLEGNNLTSEDLVEVSGPPGLKNVRRRYNFGRTITVGATVDF